MAAKPTQLTTEYANHQRDIFNPSYGNGILRNLDSVLQLRGGNMGLAIYDELERDPHVFATLQKRKMAVIGKDWAVNPASTSLRDRKAAELVERVLDSVPFDRLCMNMLDTTLKGYSIIEIIWEVRDNLIVPVNFIPRDQRRFVFDQDRQPRLMTPSNLQGEAVPPRKFIVHSTGAKDGSPYGRGLGHQLFSKVMFKNQGLGFWVAYADRFGSPTAVGEYPTHASSEQQAQLQRMLESIGQETAATIPQGVMLKLLEPASNTTTYEPLLRYLDEQISTAVLGETMSTGSKSGGLGGNGQANVHNEVRKELAEADADLLSDTLNDTLLRWIIELNLPNAAVPRVARDFSEEIDLKAQAERDKIIFEIGYKPTLKYIQETYGGEFEAIAAPALADAGGKPPASVDGTSFAEPSAPRYTPNQQAIEDRTDEAIQGLELGIPDDDIKQAIRDASSPEDLSARLAVLLQYSDTAKFDAALSKALFAADVMGYVHAE